MTTEELVNRLNLSDHTSAKLKDGEIIVRDGGGNITLMIGTQSTNIFEIDWYERCPYIKLNKPTRDWVGAQIEEYLQTPIEERRAGKRYCLFWDSDGDGTSNCLAKGPNGWGIVKIDGLVQGKLAPKSCEFTESELNLIKQDTPWLSGAIDSMKVPVTEGNK